MYKVCGFTNYECTCRKEQLSGDSLSLQEAWSLFLPLIQNVDSLDFTELDGLINEWAEDWNWHEDDYFSGSYGGSIVLYDEESNISNFDHEIISVHIDRE